MSDTFYCPACSKPMDFSGRNPAEADGYSVKWETVVDDRSHAIRRLAVPTGWIYQTQDGLKYSTVAGTVGRERDFGTPVWGPIVFVPKASQ